MARGADLIGNRLRLVLRRRRARQSPRQGFGHRRSARQSPPLHSHPLTAKAAILLEFPPSMPAFDHAAFMRATARAADSPPPGPPEIAFAGRSNVGKSSAINALTG